MMKEKPCGSEPVHAEPMMIRVYNDGHKGATAFFRNRPFLETFFSALKPVCKRRIKILVHASSVGAEPYSLALWWLHRARSGWLGEVDIDIAATDIDAGFLVFAQQATYPEALLAGMSTEEQSWFERRGEQLIIPAEARGLVRFLAPMSFVDGDPGEVFDAVLVMNALTYVSATEQSFALSRWAGYTRHVLATTAFHPDSIKSDLLSSGFVPCMENHRQIHEAWGDRLANMAVPPDSPEYSWRLPPYDTPAADSAYRYGTVFLRIDGQKGNTALSL